MQHPQQGQEPQDPSRPHQALTAHHCPRTLVSCQSLIIRSIRPFSEQLFGDRSYAPYSFVSTSSSAKAQIVPVVVRTSSKWAQLGTASLKERLSKAKLIKKVYVEDVECRTIGGQRELPSKHCRRMRTHHLQTCHLPSQLALVVYAILRWFHRRGLKRSALDLVHVPIPLQQTLSKTFREPLYTFLRSCFSHLQPTS